MVKINKKSKNKLIGEIGKMSALFIFILSGCLILCATVAFLFLRSKTISSTQTASNQINSPNDSNILTVWAWNTAAKALQELVPSFNQKYPDIKVKIIDIPYNEANQQFRIAVTTGTGFPDVWDTEGPVTPEYIKSGALLDITARASQYKNDFVGYKMGEVTDSNGKIYALPWDSAPVGMFYRRDLFAKAGIDPNSILTWDDYIAAGKKLTNAPHEYMTFISRTADVQDTFQIFLSQYGGSPFDVDGKPSFNSPQGIQAIMLMKKIYDAGIAANIGWWSTDMFAAIKSGAVASFPQGVWMGGQIKDTAPATTGEWGVIPLPAVQPGGIRTAIRGGSNLGITAKSTKADQAWKFIEFALANKDSQLKMYKDFDIFPALKSAYTDPVFSEPNPFYGNQITSQLFIKAQDSLPSNYHYGLKYTDSMNILSKEIIYAINNQKTPKQALQDAETEINSFLNQPAH